VTFLGLRQMRFQQGLINERFAFPLISIEFGLDEQVSHYQREIQTVPDALSIVGGLMGFSLAILKILI
jgi:hypothetical protein